MFALIIKDLRILKENLLSILMDCLTINLFFIVTPKFVYLVLPPMIMYSCFKSVCQYDYRYDSNVLFNSLPISRDMLVKSKYIESFLFLLVGIILSFVSTNIFSQLDIVSKGFAGFVRFNEWMNIKSINNLFDIKLMLLPSIISATMFVCSYFPIYFKFGYEKARNIFAGISILVMIIPVLIIKYAGFSIFSGVNSSALGILVCAFIVIILTIMIILSINISTKIYNNIDI